MICKNCEGNVKSDYKYCPYCGDRVVNDFHDQYEDIIPPFIIRDEEDDRAADFYAPAPFEEVPDFQPAPPEEPFSVNISEDDFLADKPYFVYQEGKKSFAPGREPARAYEPPRAAEKNAERSAHRPMGVGFKLFLIFMVVALAGAISVIGWQLLAPLI